MKRKGLTKKIVLGRYELLIAGGWSIPDGAGGNGSGQFAAS
jgi:hypothetical protein